MDVELEAVGQRIAELRIAQGWRLTDLAEATGYTLSYISQIERGVSLPSLTALATVAFALGVEMTTLIGGMVAPQVTVTRDGEGTKFTLSTGVTFRSVNRAGSERPYTAIVQPAARDTTYRHFGERFLVVLRGQLSLEFGGDIHALEALDTIHYGAHEEHRATSDVDDTTLLIVSHPALF